MTLVEERAIKNYRRDIARFKRAARQWPQDKEKYLTAVRNLEVAIQKIAAGIIRL